MIPPREASGLAPGFPAIPQEARLGLHQGDEWRGLFDIVNRRSGLAGLRVLEMSVPDPCGVPLHVIMEARFEDAALFHEHMTADGIPWRDHNGRRWLFSLSALPVYPLQANRFDSGCDPLRGRSLPSMPPDNTGLGPVPVDNISIFQFPSLRYWPKAGFALAVQAISVFAIFPELRGRLGFAAGGAGFSGTGWHRRDGRRGRWPYRCRQSDASMTCAHGSVGLSHPDAQGAPTPFPASACVHLASGDSWLPSLFS